MSDPDDVVVRLLRAAGARPAVPPERAGRVRAAVHEPTGKVLILRCAAAGPDTWAVQG